MAREIPLSRGLVTLVSDEDYADVSRLRWSAFDCGGRFYAARRQRGGAYISLHRYLMAAPRGVQVDHRNNDPLDNRRENLRLATPSQNQANSPRSRRGSSGYRGVHRSSSGLKWLAQIEHLGRVCRVHGFVDPADAARKYDELATTFFGEFAVLNFPRAVA